MIPEIPNRCTETTLEFSFLLLENNEGFLILENNESKFVIGVERTRTPLEFEYNREE